MLGVRARRATVLVRRVFMIGIFEVVGIVGVGVIASGTMCRILGRALGGCGRIIVRSMGCFRRYCWEVEMEMLLGLIDLWVPPNVFYIMLLRFGLLLDGQNIAVISSFGLSALPPALSTLRPVMGFFLVSSRIAAAQSRVVQS